MVDTSAGASAPQSPGGRGRSWGPGGWRFWGVFGIVVALLAGGLILLAGQSVGSSLSVRVIDLPAGVNGSVRVALPNGTTQQVLVSTVLSSEPGLAHLVVAPVRVGNRQYFPIFPHQTARVTQGQRTVTVVDYANIVPDSTRVLNVAQIAPGTASNGAQLNLVAGARAAYVGQIIVVGSTPLTPEGLLVKVTAVRVDSSGAQDLATVPATLPEAMPRGHLVTTFPVVNPKGVLSARVTSGNVPVGIALDSLRSPALPPRTAGLLGDKKLLQVGFDYQHKYSGKAKDGIAKCTSENASSSASYTITPQATAELTVVAHYDASWGWSWYPTVDFWVTSTETIGAGVGATATATCTYSQEVPDPAELLAEWPVDIGIPIVITPKLSWGVDVDGSMSGNTSVSAEETGSFRVGFRFDGGHLSPVVKHSFKAHAIALASFAAKLGVTTGPKLLFDIDDIAGPYAGANVEVEAKAGATAAAGATTQGTVPQTGAKASVDISAHLTGGVKMDLFGLYNLSHNFGNLLTWGPRILWEGDTNGAAVPGPPSAALVGSWYQHGSVLTVAADGTFSLTSRSFTWCGDPGVVAPCDSLVGNTITPAYTTTGTVHDNGSGAASGTITGGNSGNVGSTITFTAPTGNDTITITTPTHTSGFFCGPNVQPADTCGN